MNVITYCLPPTDSGFILPQMSEWILSSGAVAVGRSWLNGVFDDLAILQAWQAFTAPSIASVSI
jgi:hypothetical protein